MAALAVADTMPGVAEDASEITAIIPIKAMTDAKRRLADALQADQRRELAAWMLGRVLQACAGAPAIARVVVIAGDRQAAELASDRAWTVIIDPRPGLDHAIATAAEILDAQTPTLVMPADLPLVETADVTAVCAAGRTSPGVVVAPTHDGGTGALLRIPGTVIPTAFGPRSAAAHLALARRAGVPATRLWVSGLRRDLDTARDLRELRTRSEHLHAWMRASDLADRP